MALGIDFLAILEAMLTLKNEAKTVLKAYQNGVEKMM